MNAFIAMIQLDVAIMDVMWIIDIFSTLTCDYHIGLRARLDIILSGNLLFSSIVVFMIHNIWSVIPFFVYFVVITAWCIAYFVHDQFEILDRNV